MKTKKTSALSRIAIPGKKASLGELAGFFDRHDAVELVEQTPTGRTWTACWPNTGISRTRSS